MSYLFHDAWPNELGFVSDSRVTPAMLLGMYFAMSAFTIGNYSGYLRFRIDTYGNEIVNAYLAFVIIGTGAYVFVAGVFWMWAAKYAATKDERQMRLSHGIWVICLFRDLPLFWISYSSILCCGWLNGYHSFVFILQLIVFLLSFIFTWLSVVWRAARWMEYTFGEGAGGLKTGAERIVIFNAPPPMAEESLNFLPSPVDEFQPISPERGSPRQKHDRFVPPVVPKHLVYPPLPLAASPTRSSGPASPAKTIIVDQARII